MSIQQNQLINFLKLEDNSEIREYFTSNKNNPKESLKCTFNRIRHFLKTFVWINEQKVCLLANQYKDQKISSLFEGKAIQRKLIRIENNLVIQKDSLLKTISYNAKFVFEFIKHPTTVGAILPSSSSLAKEIVGEIPKDLKAEKRLILEVGPGTGIFTDKIIQRMNPSDELHLVEFDAEFCKQLKAKYQHVPNVKIFECSILDYQLSGNRKYDFIVSGLPLNAFSNEFVDDVFKKFEEVATQNTKLSYFEYLVLPDIKKLFSNAQKRANMDLILNAKNAFYQKHKYKKSKVFLNVPPANVVHHCINHSIAQNAGPNLQQKSVSVV
jgi:phosphatidylethanolamine/phosphatidyl-N-methylethanolamine N-methyltransferase